MSVHTYHSTLQLEQGEAKQRSEEEKKFCGFELSSMIDENDIRNRSNVDRSRLIETSKAEVNCGYGFE